MKINYALAVGALACGMAITPGFAANGQVKQDAKDAAHATGRTAKDAGHDVKQTTKKGVHKAAGATERGAHKVKQKTKTTE